MMTIHGILNPHKICWKTDAKAEKDNYFFILLANNGVESITVHSYLVLS